MTACQRLGAAEDCILRAMWLFGKFDVKCGEMSEEKTGICGDKRIKQHEKHTIVSN